MKIKLSELLLKVADRYKNGKPITPCQFRYGICRAVGVEVSGNDSAEHAGYQYKHLTAPLKALFPDHQGSSYLPFDGFEHRVYICYDLVEWLEAHPDNDFIYEVNEETDNAHP